ncbi:MAG: hypothetical protein AAB568_00935 [Patescibacteria group bacterium]
MIKYLVVLDVREFFQKTKNLEEIMGIILSVLGGVLQLAAFAIYNKQILKGLSKPNAATWTLWVFTSTLNCVTYIIMSGDVVKGFLPIASTVACIATFFYALSRGRFSKLNELTPSMFCRQFNDC